MTTVTEIIRMATQDYVAPLVQADYFNPNADHIRITPIKPSLFKISKFLHEDGAMQSSSITDGFIVHHRQQSRTQLYLMLPGELWQVIRLTQIDRNQIKSGGWAYDKTKPIYALGNSVYSGQLIAEDTPTSIVGIVQSLHLNKEIIFAVRPEQSGKVVTICVGEFSIIAKVHLTAHQSIQLQSFELIEISDIKPKVPTGAPIKDGSKVIQTLQVFDMEDWVWGLFRMLLLGSSAVV